ncbi:MAG TPA: DNA polymerase III subunit delta' [Pyrinomonadaceae bacterium]|jgi:DNA polymerase III subunit delta'|nr:DNA polymerase III subunit delta' [Pyrinomonadaceae bacterium]
MFDHLLGNQSAKDTIRRFLAASRIPNALLFAGPEGVGKKQFALELARSIVCREPINKDACGKCLACRRVTGFEFPGAGAEGKEFDRVFFTDHPDVGIVVPFNRTLRVGSIRALETEANFRPFEARSRVFIIDDAHKMNDAASNALLKTLEEPPATSHIFLVTSKPDALLPTIRSRSQTLRFGPVGPNEIEHLLLTTHEYSQDDAHLVAAYSMGSVAQALSEKPDVHRGRLDLAIDILRAAIVEKDVVSLLRNAETICDAKNKDSFEPFLDLLETLIHRVWSARLESSFTGEPIVDELAAEADPSRLSSWIFQIEEIRETLAVNINRKVAVDALMVNLAA